MQILTRRSDPTHRIAYGSREAAERFITQSADPADWVLEDPPDRITSAGAVQRDPIGPR